MQFFSKSDSLFFLPSLPLSFYLMIHFNSKSKMMIAICFYIGYTPSWTPFWFCLLDFDQGYLIPTIYLPIHQIFNDNNTTELIVVLINIGNRQIILPFRNILDVVVQGQKCCVRNWVWIPKILLSIIPLS